MYIAFGEILYWIGKCSILGVEQINQNPGQIIRGIGWNVCSFCSDTTKWIIAKKRLNNTQMRWKLGKVEIDKIGTIRTLKTTAAFVQYAPIYLFIPRLHLHYQICVKTFHWKPLRTRCRKLLQTQTVPVKQPIRINKTSKLPDIVICFVLG